MRRVVVLLFYWIFVFKCLKYNVYKYIVACVLIVIWGGGGGFFYLRNIFCFSGGGGGKSL